MRKLYVSHLMEDDRMKELLKESDLGMEAIDFGIGYVLDELDKNLRNYQERLRKIQPAALTIHGPFLDLNPASFDTKVQRITEERFEEAYYAAEMLKADKIIFHSCFLPDIYFEEGWVEQMAGFWVAFFEKRERKIPVCIENVLDRNCCLLRAVWEKVNHPMLGLCLDLGHAHVYSPISLAEWIECLNEAITHVHLHDNKKDKDAHLALGAGNLPAGQILKLLEETVPQASWTLENSCAEDVSVSLSFLKGKGFI